MSLSENSRTATVSLLGSRCIGVGHQGRVWAKVAAVVGGLFIADPSGLGFRALVMFAGVVELAIAAGMQVGAAPGAGVARADAASGGILNLLAAIPAIEERADKNLLSSASIRFVRRLAV